jgi:hypothetical protein
MRLGSAFFMDFMSNHWQISSIGSKYKFLNSDAFYPTQLNLLQCKPTQTAF